MVKASALFILLLLSFHQLKELRVESKEALSLRMGRQRGNSPRQ